MNTPKKLKLALYLLPLALLMTFGVLWQSAGAKEGDGIFAISAGKTIGLGKQGLYVGNQPKHVSHVYLARLSEGVPPASATRLTSATGRRPWSCAS